MNSTEPTSVEIDGREVRRRRKLAGEGMTPFAARCNISAGYLTHIERGNRKTVSPPVFAAICDALGIKDRTELLFKVSA